MRKWSEWRAKVGTQTKMIHETIAEQITWSQKQQEEQWHRVNNKFKIIVLVHIPV